MWSLGRGMGLLGWGVYLALSQGDSTAGERDGSFIVVAYFCAVGDIFFLCGEWKTCDSSFAVARASEIPLPLRCHNRELALVMGR